ncbi:MAG: hypothetical protein HUU29_04945 [Planctomycetaceae bacterium]|nr:hypothetical protein [Planctomycetaceae bacterium]
MPEQPATGNDAIRERLKAALAEVVQAEVARRVNESRTNVSRYMRDRRIPAEFCAAIVAAFDINANWLLTGEGGERKTDSASGTGNVVEQIKALVEAMNTTLKMRYSAVAKRDNLKLLRELHEAVDSYRDAVQRANEFFVPIFAKLSEQCWQAFQAKDLEAVRQLRPTLQFISTLCNDPKLSFEFLQMEGTVEVEFGNEALALDFQRRAFWTRMAQGGSAGDFHEVANNLALTLMRMRRLRESKSVLALAQGFGDSREPGPQYWTYAFYLAYIEAELGNLGAAIPEMVRAQREQSPFAQKNAVGIPQLMMALAKVLSIDELLAALSKASFASDFSAGIVVAKAVQALICLESIDQLKEARETLGNKLKKGRKVEAPLYDLWSAALLSAHTSPSKSLVKDFVESADIQAALASENPSIKLAPHIAACQLARLTKDTKRAKKEFENAQDMIDKEDPAVTFPIMLEALHRRNALALFTASSDEHQKANTFLSRAVSQGYVILDDVLRASK